MKYTFPTAGLLAASIVVASAAPIVVNTVGVMNTNAHTIINATGSISNTTFATDIATAFSNNTGGVWSFDGASFSINVGETVTMAYGTSQANNLVMTIGGTNGINTGFVTTTEATSGSTGMGLQGDGSTRTFTLNRPLLALGIFVGNRGDNSRTSTLTVTYLDNTTASTSGATAGPASGSNYFEGLSGTVANPIVSFSLAQNNFVRYDDLGFVVAPSSDSDHDGLLDSWEIQYFGNITTTAGGPTEDYDSDGMTDKQEYDNNTNPTNSDTDGDGLTDGDEFHGTSNAFAPGTPTNPALADSDSDGVNDFDENGSLNTEFGNAPTNPNNVDTDGDGMKDSYELANNTPTLGSV